MADVQTTTWSETAASNNAATPDGWPEGQSYASVNNCAREMMGALKREWNRSHATISTAGTSTALTLTYTTSPGALVQGLQFAFRLNQDIGASATLNVNGLGATNILKQTVSGTAAVLANDFRSGQLVVVEYDTTTTSFIVISDQPKGNGLYHVKTTSIAAGTSVVLTLPSQFKTFMILGKNVVTKTNGTYLAYRHSVGGTSYSSSTNDYSSTCVALGTSANTVLSFISTADTQGTIFPDAVGGSGVDFTIYYDATLARMWGQSCGNRYNSGSTYVMPATVAVFPNTAGLSTITNLALTAAGVSFSAVGSVTVFGLAEGT